jgi:hypothetical protein
MEYEYLKNKREGILANISKDINNKMIRFLKERKIFDLIKNEKFFTFENLGEKCFSLKKKIRDYLNISEKI